MEGGGRRKSNNRVLIQCEGSVKDDHIVRRVKGVKVKVATSSRDGSPIMGPTGNVPGEPHLLLDCGFMSLSVHLKTMQLVSRKRPEIFFETGRPERYRVDF